MTIKTPLLKVIVSNVCLLLYHLIAKHIPTSFPLTSFGFWLRRLLCARIFGNCGHGLMIEHKVDFGRGKLLHVGDYVYIGRATQINLNAEVHIAHRAYIGEEVLIYTQDHGNSRTDITMQEQPYIRAPVSVGEQAVVGSRAIILKGISIGRNATIEVGTVVPRDVPEGSTVIGVPARPLQDNY